MAFEKACEVELIAFQLLQFDLVTAETRTANALDYGLADLRTPRLLLREVQNVTFLYALVCFDHRVSPLRLVFCPELAHGTPCPLASSRFFTHRPKNFVTDAVLGVVREHHSKHHPIRRITLGVCVSVAYSSLDPTPTIVVKTTPDHEATLGDLLALGAPD